MADALKSPAWRLVRRIAVIAMCAAGAAIAAAPPGQDPSALSVLKALYGPCGDRVCPALSDPLARKGFVLRLMAELGYVDMKAIGAFSGVSGGKMSVDQFAAIQKQAAERVAQSPAARVSAGAGEAQAGRFEAAQTLLKQALDLSVAAEDALAQAASLSDLGVVAAMQGRYDEARAQMTKALEVYQRGPTKPLALEDLYPAQIVEMMKRLNPEASRKELEQGMARQRMLADLGAFFVELNLGSLAAQLARYDEAMALFAKASGYEQLNRPYGITRIVLGEQALLYAKAGQAAKADEFRRRAQAAASGGDPRILVMMVSEIAIDGQAIAASTSAAPPAEPPKPAPAPGLMGKIDAMVSAFGQAQEARVRPSLTACEGGPCAGPDPATRKGYVLRLAGVPRSQDEVNQGMLMKAADSGSGAYRVSVGVRAAMNGQMDAARATWSQVLEQERGKPGASETSEAAALSNLGVAAALQGHADEARAKMQAAYAAYQKAYAAHAPAREARDALHRPQALPDLQASGAAAAMLDGMRQQQQAALPEASGSELEGATLVALNLANLEAQLGRPAEAERWLAQALEQSIQYRHGSRLVLGETALLERFLGHADAAEDAANRAREGSTPDDSWPQVEVGFLAFGAPVPVVAAASAGGPQAPSSDEARSELVKGSASEVVHARLAAEAAERERAGDLPGAIAAQLHAAVLAGADGNAERERAALAGLQRLHVTQGNADAAIFYGKRSVNAIQRLRGSLGQVDRASRQAFLAEKKQVYTLLAQTLLDRDRLAEAEQVLRLLKEDEGQQFQGSSPTRGTVPYDSQETAALVVFAKTAEHLRPLDAERARLAGGITLDGALDSRAAIERARFTNLGRTDLDLAKMESGLARSIAEAAQCRDQAASSSAARDAVAGCTLSLRLSLKSLGEGASSLQVLKRDSVRFLTAPSPVELRQIDAVLAHFAAMQARVEKAIGPADAPLSATLRQQLAVASVMSVMFDTGRLHELWALQLEMDDIADRFALGQLGVDKTLASHGAPAFSAADTRLLETGTRVMQALPAGTAAVYYLEGDQRLDILLVSAQGRSKARSAVSRVAMGQRIAMFRRALNNPALDAVAPARALYEQLIAPIDGALKSARATTLMLALEGPLRYVPFAALHDGQGWLAERYATSLYTTAAPNALTAAPAPAWQVAAFGSTQGSADLQPLPSVKGELQAIVRDPAQGTHGVMPGQIRLDRDFTAQTLRDALGRHPNVVHIASHFVFRAEDAGSSFLLLGDGGQLSLARIATPAFRFDQVDLVTLSACETALVAGNSFGQEVEALGTLLQAQGAAAVLSTLWSVADASTAQFMSRLYEAREAERSGAGHVSRAQALRAAQLSFIRGEPGGGAPTASQDTRGAARAGDASSPQNAARPYAHPFYWAPFVLMGNWL